MRSTIWNATILRIAFGALAAVAAVGVAVGAGAGAAAATGSAWAWTAVSPTVSPGPLTGASAAFDPALGAVVLFGGSTGTTTSAATYEWTMSGTTGNWNAVSTATAPPGVSGAAMTYDPSNTPGTLVLYGGTESDGTISNSTYTFDGSTWTQLSPAASPPPLTGAAMAYDPQAGVDIRVGGPAPTSAGGPNYSTYGLSLTASGGPTWTALVPYGTASPSFRYGASLVYDPQTQTLVLFGGQTPSGYLNDTWTYNGATGTWSEATPATSPPARAYASMVYDAASGTVILFGGTNASGQLGDMWQWDGSTWTQITANSDPAAATLPPARSGAAMAEYTPSGSAEPSIVLYGGTGAVTASGSNQTTIGALDDTWTGFFLPPSLSVATSSLAPAQVGQAYSVQLTAANAQATVSWALGQGSSLPAGLTLSATGLLAGTPTAAGSYSFTVQATETIPVTGSTTGATTTVSASESYTLVVVPPTLTLTTQTLPGGQLDVPYSASLSAQGGTTPYTWAVTSGSLPTGLSLEPSGTIAGTPQASGTFTFTVTVTDSSSPTPESASQTYTVDIGLEPVALSFSGLPGGQVGQSYAETLQATGGDGTYVWSVTGSLPPGLTLDPSGTISGKPTQAGTYTFQLDVADTSSTPLTASASETVTISPAGNLVENYNATFSATNQSMWAPGSATSGTINVPIFQESWNTSASAGNIDTVGGGCWWVFCVPTTYYGGSINASTNGNIGLSLALTGTAGSVNVSYPGQFQVVVVPPPQGSQLVTVQTAWTPDPSQAQITSTPMSGSLALDGNFAFGASVNGSLCVFACSNITIVPNFELGPYSGQIFSVSSSQASSLPLISLLSFLSGISGVSGDVGFPEPSLGPTSVASDGVTVQAQGAAPFLTLNINGAQVLLCLITDGLGCSIPLSPSVSFAGVDLGYTILFAGINASYSEAQAFQFNPGTPQVTLALGQASAYTVLDPSGSTYATGNASSIVFPAGDSVQITAPWTGLSITPSFSIPGNSFANATSITSQYDYAVKMLSLTATLDGKGINLGPLVDVEYDTPQCSTTSLTSLALSEVESGGLCGSGVPVFSTSWQLGGFNTVTEPTIVQKIDTEPPVTTVALSGSQGLAYDASTKDFWFTSAVTLTFTSVDNLDGVGTISYSEDGGQTWQTLTNTAPSPPSGSGTFTGTAQVTTPGVYTVDYYGTDTSGNVETQKTVTFTYLPPPTVTGVRPANGPAAGGTVVTVTGTNFALPNGTPVVTAVYFGSVKATAFTTVSATELTATLPAEAAGTVDVTVTTLSATSATSAADQFTILPLPTVTSVAPINGPKAGATAVVVTGTGFTTATQVLFGDTPAASFTVKSDGEIDAVAPAHAPATVDIRVITACGLDQGQTWPTATSCGTSPTSSADQFVFLPLPAVTAITPANGPAAGGTTVTIDGRGFTTATAVYFGTLPAQSFKVVSDGEITAVSPDAGTVSSPTAMDITVVTSCATDGGQTWPTATSCGTSPTSSADQFVFLPLPTLTGLGRQTGVTSGGTWVTIDGSGFTTAVAVSFGSAIDNEPGVNFQILSDSQISALLPPGQGTVQVTVTTACADDQGVTWPDATSCLTTPTGAQSAFTYFALLATQPTATGIAVDGGGTITSPAGEIVVDSSGQAALRISGRGSITATAVAVVGTSDVDRGGNVTPPVTTLAAPVLDPFASLTAPDTSAMTVVSTRPYVVPGRPDDNGATRTLTPGVYEGGIRIDGRSQVTLAPGVYVIVGGDFAVGGQATVNGPGALVVLVPNGEGRSGSVVVSGEATLNLGEATLEGIHDLSILVFPGTGPGPEAGPDGLGLPEGPGPGPGVNVSGDAHLTTAGTVYLRGIAVTLPRGESYTVGGILAVSGNAHASLAGAVVNDVFVSGDRAALDLG
jgi:hypothetical protein